MTTPNCHKYRGKISRHLGLPCHINHKKNKSIKDKEKKEKKNPADDTPIRDDARNVQNVTKLRGNIKKYSLAPIASNRKLRAEVKILRISKEKFIQFAFTFQPWSQPSICIQQILCFYFSLFSHLFFCGLNHFFFPFFFFRTNIESFM